MTTLLSLGDVVTLLGFYKREHAGRSKIYSGRSFTNRPFPSDISENIVKNFIEQVEKRKCFWSYNAKHDLFLPATGRRIEVKAFSNLGQRVSFTCSQSFDLLYVVDGCKFQLDTFTIYFFDFSSQQMQNMKVGLDNTSVRFLNIDKRTVNTTLKRLVSYAKEKNYYHSKREVKLGEKVILNL